ncbi:MAG TPA: protein kinase [Thermoanaerobaculia bacterium]|nr:protein kinase [Thermoanaerobaculia bacterium]
MGPYEIVALLGKGGMGEVYRARDERLGRDVAIKVLPKEFAREPERLRRFEKEARSASALSDPHIVMVFDVGEANGIRFFASELVEGSNLRQLLESGSLSREKALDVAEQIASGLAAAHEKGIVHRDLKPENILITKSGLAKIGDFGLAKLVESSISDGPTIGGHQTSAGMVLGTVAYMSPEQVRGQPVDRRSDIFSFGALLYEMLTGRKAFQGDTAAETMARILRDEPEPLEQVTPDVSAPVRAIVERCLAKEPTGRYDGAHDLARDLASSRAQPVVVCVPAPVCVTKAPSRWLVAVGTVALVAVLAILAALLTVRQDRPRPGQVEEARGLLEKLTGQRRPVALPPAGSSTRPPAAESSSIAVLPFVNMTSDANQEYFSDGLSEELLNSLAHVPQLRVISRTSSFQFKGKNEDIRTIARKLNVGRVLEGSVRKSGKRVRITAQLVSAATGAHQWSQTYDRDMDDIFHVQEEIAGEVVKALQVILVDGTLPKRPTPRSTEAYTLLLKGRYFADRRTKDDLAKSVEHLRRAIELDPRYAVAWAALARAYATQAASAFAPVDESVANARKAAEKALDLDPNLAAGHAMLGWIKASYEWEWEAADLEFKRALELDPGSSGILANAGLIAHSLGRFEESIELYRRAIARNPLQGGQYANLAISLLYAGRLDEAEAACRQAIDIRPEAVTQKYLLGQILLARGKLEAARQAVAQEPDEGWRLVGQALVYHGLGRPAESDAAVKALTTEFSADMPFQIAEVRAYRGEIDLAFEWLERARALRDTGFLEMKGDPLLRNLESDPRYRAFLRKIRLPE